MRKLAVDLGDRSYNIYIDSEIISQSGLLESYCKGQNCLILSNQTIAPLYLEQLALQLPSKRVFNYAIPDGESYKNLENYAEILNFLIEKSFRRNDTLIALGGGVVGDLGGFVAASYQRGMGFIQVPTSLLAQVDSSVGGKTAVNHPLGKNMIGAFYQPQAVLIDTLTLDTLPEREYFSGLAEVIKYAILGEENIHRILAKQTKAVLNRDKATLMDLIYYSCAQKAKIVASDEKEKGVRALLNLGHTFGHAIERVTNYKSYLHGEAVAIGIKMAINLSLAKNMISEQQANSYSNLLLQLNLPITLSETVSVDTILSAMKLDKKNINEYFRLVLPDDKTCQIIEEKDIELVGQAIQLQLAS
jgi:3-dehydroquinate synthase